MNTQTQTNFWNKISAGLFFVGLVICALLILPNTWESLIYGILIFSGLSFFGLICAAAALVKNEKNNWLSWLGLVLNCAILLAMLIFVIN